ncbi:MAG: hypothetical protein ACR2OA_06145 [Rubripirellula sp.]
MTNFQRLATVRTRFLRWLQDADQRSEELGPEGSLIHRESMLIRDEFFCGRKFHAQHYTAVWFIEEDVLKIHQADGSLELVLRGSEIDDLKADESPVEAANATKTALIKLQDQLASEEAIDQQAPQDASEPLEIEPRILKLTVPHENAADSSVSSAQGSTGPSKGQQSNEQQSNGMDSGEQEIRKAA